MDEEVCFSDDDADEKELCSICFSKMTSEDSHTLECEHKFHTSCILQWFSKNIKSKVASKKV